MSRLLLIDGDNLVYRAAFAVERTRYLVDGIEYGTKKEADEAQAKKEGLLIWSRVELDPLDHALHTLKVTINGLQERFQIGRVETRVYLSPSVGNFRDSIAVRAKYKGNRDNQRRPTYFTDCRNYLLERFDATIAVGQEADDCIGIAMSAHPESICVSLDKDLDQLPGRHVKPYPSESPDYAIGVKQGYFNFLTQVLTGDSTDNVPGIPGTGPKTAAKVLAGASNKAEAWGRILQAYASAGLTDKDALETARLVWVRRKEGELWEPPT